MLLVPTVKMKNMIASTIAVVIVNLIVIQSQILKNLRVKMRKQVPLKTAMMNSSFELCFGFLVSVSLFLFTPINSPR